jgi:Glycosyl transferase family 11
MAHRSPATATQPTSPSTANVVTIWMIGGLGNQMFQYAACKSLAKSLGAPLRITTFDYRRPGRPYLLSELSIAETATDFVPFFKRAPARMTKTPGGTRALNIAAQLGLWPTLYREASPQFDPDLSKLRGRIELRGYFMSERYFAAERPAILRYFQPSSPLSPSAAQMQDRIRKAKTPVALHVRGGDFLTPGAPPMLDQAYYSQAIGLIDARLGGPADYILFTDDVAHARTVLPPDLAVTVFEPNDDRPWEDMHLMAQCHHNIIANSSFSWWGAWLNDHPDKIVVAPKDMLPGAKSSVPQPDLYPPQWITLSPG